MCIHRAALSSSLCHVVVLCGFTDNQCDHLFSPREREGREKLWCPHSYTHGVISFFSHDAETTFFWRIRFCLPSAHTRHTCTLLCSFCGTPLRQSVQSVRRLCACCVVFRCLHVPPKRGALQRGFLTRYGGVRGGQSIHSIRNLSIVRRMLVQIASVDGWMDEWTGDIGWDRWLAHTDNE